MRRLFLAAFCALALVGYILPAVNVHLSFLGVTRSFDFGLRSPFEGDGAFGRMELDASDLSDILGDNDFVRDVVVRIVFGVVFYVAALLLFAVAAVLFFLREERRVLRNALFSVACVLHIAAARIILTVPDIVADALAEIEGFFGLLVRFLLPGDVLVIDMAAGYWLVLAVMVCVLLAEAAPLLYSRIGERK